MKTASLYQMLFPNGKRYIGVSVNPRARHRDHLSHARRGTKLPVYEAVRKHGAENVAFSVLLIGPHDYVLEMERRCIDAFGTRAPGGYNVSFGGDASPALAPEVRDKIRASKLRHWQDQAYREKITANAKAFRPNAEQRRRNGEAKKKAWQDPIYRQKCVDGHVGHKQSDLTKARRGDSLRKAWAAGKGRNARSKAMSGRVWANDGVQHRQFRPGETIPGGWVRGMIKKGRT